MENQSHHEKSPTGHGQVALVLGEMSTAKVMSDVAPEADRGEQVFDPSSDVFHIPFSAAVETVAVQADLHDDLEAADGR